MKTNETTPIPQGYKATPLGIIPQEWEVRRFRDIGNFLRNNTLPRDKMSESEGCIQNIHYGDVLIKYKEILKVSKANIPWIVENSKDSPLGDMLQNGDIVISDTAEDYTVGKATELMEIDGASVVAGLHTMPFRPLSDLFSPCFLGYYVNSMAYRSQLYALVQGIKVCAISKKAMSGTFLIVPPLAEQKKIAEVLGLWDKAIEKQSQLIEQLTLRKRGLMQQLLTAKRRLPGFSGPWKEVKLGEISKIGTGNKNNEDKVANGKYPFFVRSSNIERINSYSYDGEAILIPGEGKIGEIIHYVNGKFDYHQRVYKISNFSNCLGKYLYYYLMCFFGKQAVNNSVKACVDSLRLSTFTNMKILYPSFEEQTAIAQVLTVADREIELAQQKLELLRQQKHGLMQQLLTGKKRIKY